MPAGVHHLQSTEVQPQRLCPQPPQEMSTLVLGELLQKLAVLLRSSPTTGQSRRRARRYFPDPCGHCVAGQGVELVVTKTIWALPASTIALTVCSTRLLWPLSMGHLRRPLDGCRGGTLRRHRGNPTRRAKRPTPQRSHGCHRLRQSGQFIIGHETPSPSPCPRHGGVLPTPVGADRFVIRSHPRAWGWRAASRSLARLLAKQHQNTADHGQRSAGYGRLST